MPLRAVATGLQISTALASASETTAAAVTRTAGKTAVSAAEAGFNIAAIPLREGARALSGDLPHETLSRRCSRGENRAWIEVRGLDGARDGGLGRAVLDGVRAHPGVTSASLNYPLSRVVVHIGDPGTSLRELCRAVDNAEKRCCRRHVKNSLAPPASLPGDGIMLAASALTVATNATGLGLALTGRALRWPRLPLSILAGVQVVNYQPLLRRLLEDRIGRSATDTVMALAVAAAETVTQSPASLSVGLLLQSLRAAESRAEARAWRQHEPTLARYADQPPTPSSSRPKPPRARAVERYASRFALIQALSVGVVGASTRSLNMAATAALVTAPKATRTVPEAFAAALGQGLADRHAVLPLRPEALRQLDRVDAIVIDPRVLYTDELRVARIHGADEGELSAAWNRAQLVLEKNGLPPGWHSVPGIAASGPDDEVEALFRPALDPLASAVVAEAHRTVAERVIFARMTPENKVQIVQTLERHCCPRSRKGANSGNGCRRRCLCCWGHAGEVAFAIIGSAITGISPLNTRQLLLVNMLTGALPAAALAVSKPSDPADAGARGPNKRALWRAVGIRGTTTAAAATAAWTMAGVTGLPRRASTVALVALVGAQLGQTLLDSHAWLVVLTALGSLAVMGTLISIPVVSQLLGCTPLGPLGWAQALGAAAAATVAVAVLNRVLTGPDKSAPADPEPPETQASRRDEASDRSPESPPPRHATAAHRVRTTARSAPKQQTKLSDRPGRRSSTYVRR
jgi:Cation transporting ATPase, C-terminus